MMLTLTIKNKTVHIKNQPIKVGDQLSFTAVAGDMKLVTLAMFANKLKIISSVPSIDTKTCNLQTAHFNRIASNLSNLVIITISKDLPFAQNRFCEKLKLNSNFQIWSDYRQQADSFSNTTNLIIDELQLLARSVMVIDENNIVRYIQIVKEVTSEPNYHEVLQFIKTLK